MNFSEIHALNDYSVPLKKAGGRWVPRDGKAVWVKQGDLKANDLRWIRDGQEPSGVHDAAFYVTGLIFSHYAHEYRDICLQNAPHKAEFIERLYNEIVATIDRVCKEEEAAE